MMYAEAKETRLQEKEFGVWQDVDKRLQAFKALPFQNQGEGRNASTSKPKLKRGWKTVRVFISSTFKDFHNEREVLVRNVFPELRLWCQKQKIHILECDLRWGVTKDDSNRSSEICLEQIDECKKHNEQPFFINLTSERIGYIPGADQETKDSEVLKRILRKYQCLVKGLSVTEMEIVHAAYSLQNPNAIFMLRTKAFLDLIPENLRKSQEFEDLLGEINDKQREIKKNILKEKLSKDQYFQTKAETHHYSPLKCDTVEEFPFVEHLKDGGTKTSSVKFIKMELDKDSFDNKVLTFLKRRILACYPPCDHWKSPPEPTDVEVTSCVKCQSVVLEFEEYDGMHNAYMEWKAESVIGRDDDLKLIDKLVSSSRSKGNPLLVFGEPGVGKSALMARVVKNLLDKQKDGYDRVFFHFVGAVSKSTETSLLQRRIIKHLLKLSDSEIKVKPSELSQQVYGALTKKYKQDYVIIVDAFNQLDEGDVASLLNWIPKKGMLSVKCIFSMVRDCKHAKAFQAHFPDTHYWIDVEKLKPDSAKEIVRTFLLNYGKKLHEQDELNNLVNDSNPDCCNPLWLLTACDELRRFGVFKALGKEIKNLPTDLAGLLEHILIRHEAKKDSAYLQRATLCLIEVSKCGLLESELRDILGYQEECFKNLSADAIKDWKDFHAVDSKLTSYRWAEIYRAVQVFIRPYGDSGEGQLDFHHRSFSKAVRKSYGLQAIDKGSTKPCCDENVKFWHRVLASYFCQESNAVAEGPNTSIDNVERNAKFYPYHALAIGDYEGLENFLCRWPVIEAMFSEVYSGDLIKYWQQIHSHCGHDTRICVRYLTLLQCIGDREDAFAKNTVIAKILSQATKYRDAETPAKSALDIAGRDSTEYTEAKIEAKILVGEILKDLTRFNTCLENKDIPDMRRAYDLQTEAVKELKGLLLKAQEGESKTKLEKLYVQQLNALASYCAFLAAYVEAPVSSDQEPVDRVTDEEAKELKKEGLAVLTEAQKLVKQLTPKDSLLELECLSTQGRLQRGNLDKCVKIWKSVIENSVNILGTNNALKTKALFNLGSNYEDRAVDLHVTKYSEAEGHYVTAYKYFVDYYRLLLEVYGPEHGLCKEQRDYLQKDIFSYLLELGKIPKSHVIVFDDEKLDDGVQQLIVAMKPKP